MLALSLHKLASPHSLALQRYNTCLRSGSLAASAGCSKSPPATRTIPIRSITARERRFPTVVNETISASPTSRKPKLNDDRAASVA